MSGAGEFGIESCGPEEHERCILEQKLSGEFWVVEKLYGLTWAPLNLELWLDFDDTERFIAARSKNFPDEKLRVTQYAPKLKLEVTRIAELEADLMEAVETARRNISKPRPGRLKAVTTWREK